MCLPKRSLGWTGNWPADATRRARIGLFVPFAARNPAEAEDAPAERCLCGLFRNGKHPKRCFPALSNETGLIVLPQKRHLSFIFC